MPHVSVTPVIDPSVRGLCPRPYEGHPRGCPNFGRAARCPPRAPLLDRVYDAEGPFFAIYSTFDLGEHVARMRERHPGWSPRQLLCVLYWQGTARKRLRGEIASFRRDHAEREWLVETTPEALGLDVSATMREAGVELPWPPSSVAYCVALAGLAIPRTMESKAVESEERPRVTCGDCDHFVVGECRFTIGKEPSRAEDPAEHLACFLPRTRD